MKEEESNYKYKIEILYDHDEDEYVAFHPELGIYTCRSTAKTPQKAIEALENNKEELIEYFLAKGDAIPKPIYLKDYLHQIKHKE